jgi:hypothetical protein
MLHIMDRFLLDNLTLRCVWTSANIGANAPLTATWIESSSRCVIPRHDAVRDSAEGDSWICAA